jgi:hypothetical protein
MGTNLAGDRFPKNRPGRRDVPVNIETALAQVPEQNCRLNDPENSDRRRVQVPPDGPTARE